MGDVQRHAVALAVILRDGLVLLGHRRADRAWYPDCWDLIGGHVEPGETPLDAVRRECREELGIEVREIGELGRVHHREPAATDPDFHAFMITAWDGEPVNAAPAEHDAVDWFDPGRLDALRVSDPAIGDLIRHAVAEGAQRRGRPNRPRRQDSP